VSGAGPVFCDEDDMPLTSRDMNASLQHDILGDLLTEHPSLFLAEDVIGRSVMVAPTPKLLWRWMSANPASTSWSIDGLRRRLVLLVLEQAIILVLIR
jgi:hypothetical protein